MPRKDTYHDAVKNALIKNGWIITHDPYLMEYQKETLYVDIGAEAAIGAEKEGRKIAVEIKSFLGKSGITDMYHALGQYIFYRTLVERDEPDRVLFLAMPKEAYAAVLDTPEGRKLITKEHLKIVLYDSKQETIDQWIE